tara:strand:+ start:232 stop:417 length:186 start_codon:yes stop_codon:yes gene_type:complete
MTPFWAKKQKWLRNLRKPTHFLSVKPMTKIDFSDAKNFFKGEKSKKILKTLHKSVKGVGLV